MRQSDLLSVIRKIKQRSNDTLLVVVPERNKATKTLYHLQVQLFEIETDTAAGKI